MTATFHVGDAIEVMGKLPENSVDLVLTSPPFLALRSYLPADHPDKALEGGSQATPGQYIDWLVDVVEACDRVLAPHGSMCIELGDTYSGGWAGDSTPFDERYNNEGGPRIQDRRRTGHAKRNKLRESNLRGWALPKSLSLIPELFRLTLVYGTNPLTGRQTERWRLRNVVRWVRPNPPVGALGDKFRPATSELMVFCKSAKRYFDLDAVRESPSPNTHSRSSVDRFDLPSQKRDGNWSTLAQNDYANPAGAPPLDWWNIPLLEGEEETRYGKQQRPTVAVRTNEKYQKPRENDDHKRLRENWDSSTAAGAPPLDWWNIPPGGYEGAHYAVFPPELCIKPIKAMCPEKVCRQCGEPSRRIVEAFRISEKVPGRNKVAVVNSGYSDHAPGDGWQYDRTTTGFSDCGHDDWRPGVVLDPFGGSGTTALVATGHGRDCILIDLDERNYELALQRVGPFILERAG